MADNIYIFDKYDKSRSLLGEIQRDFNMSLVMDGTKDSMQVLVINFADKEVEPNSIIWHENTNTWWIVEKDNVNGYYGENGKLYVHELSLLGAIELLNARDLTDCGFKDNFYTITQFLNRLMSLSTFEFDTTFVGDSIDFDQKIDYIKTYENYSLLTALREFFNGYNCDIKMSFTTESYGGYILLDSAIINIYPKSGRDDLATINLSDFDDVKEVKNTNRNSYGSTVLSNAQNVVSTKMKYYPIQGGISLSANSYKVNGDNAILRLPSNVFDVDYVDMYWQASIITSLGNRPAITSYFAFADIDSIYNFLRYYITQNLDEESYYELLLADFDSQEEQIKQRLRDLGTIRFYKGCGYDAMHNKIVIPANSRPELYIPELDRYDDVWQTLKIALFDEEVWNTLNSKVQGLYWKRGSNLISGFNFLDAAKTGTHRKISGKSSTLGSYCDGSETAPDIYQYTHNGNVVFFFFIDFTREYITIFNTLGT